MNKKPRLAPVLELEAQRMKFEEIQQYLTNRNFPRNVFRYDAVNGCWVVGSFYVGKTLTEAVQCIPKNL